MGVIGPYSELIYLVGTNYEGRIRFRFTFVHKSVLVKIIFLKVVSYLKL